MSNTTKINTNTTTRSESPTQKISKMKNMSDKLVSIFLNLLKSNKDKYFILFDKGGELINYEKLIKKNLNEMKMIQLINNIVGFIILNRQNFEIDVLASEYPKTKLRSEKNINYKPSKRNNINATRWDNFTVLLRNNSFKRLPRDGNIKQDHKNTFITYYRKSIDNSINHAMNALNIITNKPFYNPDDSEINVAKVLCDIDDIDS